MAATQQYSLRWNNYLRHLTTSLENLRTNDDFVDVSLCCDGRKIKAHKVVLSSCSGYFKDIFRENPHPHPVIIFKFIKFDDLNSIIQFMYQGEVNVQQEALQSFLQTAELLAVQGLTAEEKDKKTPLLPLIEEQKLCRNLPNTILRPCDITSATTATTQTIEIPAATMLHAQLATQQQQSKPAQQQQQQQQQAQIQHVQVQQQTQQQITAQQLHHTVNTQQMQQQQQATQQQQQQPQQIQIATVSSIGNNNAVTLPTIAVQQKKRKITFSDDENIYTAEAVDEQTMVKTSDMSFLRGTVNEYIVSEVEESQQLSESSTQANAQDNNNSSGGNVTQYHSEYEILTESEVDEKNYQNDTEITIEMNRILNTNCSTAATSGNTQNSTLVEVSNTVALKSDAKGNNSADMQSNKWAECQFCKMVITTVNLWRHIRTQHTPQPPRKCELCNKNFKNKYSLREHIRISHEQKIAIKTEN